MDSHSPVFGHRFSERPSSPLERIEDDVEQVHHGHQESKKSQAKVFINGYLDVAKKFVREYPIIATVVLVASVIFGFQNLFAFTFYRVSLAAVQGLVAWIFANTMYTDWDEFLELCICSLKWNDPSQRENVEADIRRLHGEIEVNEARRKAEAEDAEVARANRRDQSADRESSANPSFRRSEHHFPERRELLSSPESSPESSPRELKLHSVRESGSYPTSSHMASSLSSSMSAAKPSSSFSSIPAFGRNGTSSNLNFEFI